METYIEVDKKRVAKAHIICVIPRGEYEVRLKYGQASDLSSGEFIARFESSEERKRWLDYHFPVSYIPDSDQF